MEPFAILRQSLTFQNLDDVSLKNITALGEVRLFQHDAVIVSEGEHDMGFYIILHGTVIVCLDSYGEAKVLAELHSGDFFGEMSVLTNQPRSATIIARGPVTLLFYDEASSRTLFLNHPDLRERMTHIGIERTEQNLSAILDS